MKTFLPWILALGAVSTWSMGTPAWSQITPFPVTESMRAAQDVARGLNAPDSLAQALLEAALPTDACLAHWNAVQDSLEAAPISEADLLAQLTEVRAALGACREDRRLAMRNALPDDLKRSFDELAQPNRPNVLHFGLHNRMECVVCKPEKPESP